jgi:hypothetical protein
MANHEANPNSYMTPEMRSAFGKKGAAKTNSIWKKLKSVDALNDPPPSIPPGLRAELENFAKEAGVEVPKDLSDAIKLKRYFIDSERLNKLKAENETIEKTRIPVELVDDYTERLINTFLRHLDTVHRIFEVYTEFTPEQQILLQKRLREWSEKVRDTISNEEAYERQSERMESAQSGEPGQPVAET